MNVVAVIPLQRYGGTWSDNGCHVVKEKELTVECACNHLTNFAILMQVKEFEVRLKDIFKISVTSI